MTQATISELGRSPASLDDDRLAARIVWLNSDLDLWLAGLWGLLPQDVAEDLLADAYAERERRGQAS